MKIAVIDKCPSNMKYEKHFDFEFDLFHLSSVRLTKVLKKDVDIDIDLEIYDYVILIGSEATKHYTKGVNVSDMSGHLVDEKYIPLTNPAMLIFKPEGKNEFEKALNNLKAIIRGEKAENTRIDYKGILDRDEANAWLDELIASKPSLVVWDTETTGLDPREGYILGVSLCYKAKHAAYISTDIMDEEIIGKLKYIAITFKAVFHNSKFDTKMLAYHLNIVFLESNTDDTILMHYLLDERQGTHGLKVLALKYTGFGDYDRELEDFKNNYCKTYGINKEDFTYDLIPFDILSKYACIDVCVTYELFFLFNPIILGNAKLLSVYRNILIPGSFLLAAIEEHGLPFSKDKLQFAQAYLDNKIKGATEVLYSFKEIRDFEVIQGEKFNPNSVVQLRKLLFDYIGLPPVKLTTSGKALSTDAEVLDELSSKHPVPSQITALRKAGKMKGTYVDNILAGIHRDGRLRTNFNLIFTTSGRLSSSGKFNGQTIPRDDPIIKGCIEAEPGYVLVLQDLSTAEMYYAAVLSGDKALMSAFSAGEDFHSYIAKLVFNLPCAAKDVKKLYPAMRQAAKAISFGILYGSGAQKVADVVSSEGEPIDKDKAQEFIDLYFSKFPQLKRWLSNNQEFIKKNGYIYSFFGRKRRLNNVFSPDRAIASHEVRSGINFLIQSVASDVNLLGAIEAEKEFKRLGLRARTFALIHDAILLHAHKDDAEQAAAVLKQCTQKDRGCSIPGFPIGVDSSIVQDYSEGKFDAKYGEEYNEYKVSGFSDR